MFERLVLCEFAVADLTTANANVYYELGVRHAVRPFTTVLLFADGVRLPFDVGPLRGLPYHLDEQGAPVDPRRISRRLTEQLIAARNSIVDSPIFQLLDGLGTPDISRLKTDIFRDQVEYSAAQGGAPSGPDRGRGRRSHRAGHDLPDLAGVEVGVVIDRAAVVPRRRGLRRHGRSRGAPDGPDAGAVDAGARAVRVRPQPGREQRPTPRRSCSRSSTSVGRRARRTGSSAACTRIAGRPPWPRRQGAVGRGSARQGDRRPTGRASRPTGATPTPASTPSS